MNLKSLAPHGLAIGVFLIAMLLMFYPAFFKGKTLEQHDIKQWRAASKQAREYREETGKEPLWTNALFSGMPATLVSTQYYGDIIRPIQKVLDFARPYSLIFIACLGFYIMMLTFRVDPMVAAIGAVCFGLSSYLIIGLSAGHNNRIAAVAFMPFVIGGVNLVFKGNYKWGFLLAALGSALEIRVNHLQITYYLLIILVVFGLVKLIEAIRQKDKSFITKSAVLALAGVLAAGANSGRLLNIMQYSQYSTRGTSELAEKESGLEKSYVFEFSNSLFEPLVTFIPNFYGGSSSQELDDDSALAEALENRGATKAQVRQYTQSVPTYWGKQRLSAPYYAGAIMVFLTVLSFFILDKRTKLWLIIVLALGIILSWGDNFASVNYFLFEHLPGYNKFRSVTFTIILSILAIAALGTMALDKILKDQDKKSEKRLFYAVAISGGFALLAAVFAGMGSYRAPIDETLSAQQTPEWFISAIRDDRARLLRNDALRSAFFIILSAGAIWLVLKKNISASVGAGVILILALFDMVLVDKRYLDKDNFREKTDQTIVPTPADQRILEDESDYRVLNLRNPFNDASTAYFHNAIGGYHGAKLGRYQDLIANHISPEMNRLITSLQGEGNVKFKDLHVINMLNAKYIKYGPARENVIVNASANGSAWFVEEVIDVHSPKEEIDKLGDLDTKKQAVIDRKKFPEAKNLSGGKGQITLMEKTPRELTYQVKASEAGLAVFAEIYYPKGWKAFIDGEPANILRVNYVLRALDVPEGEYEIVFRYDPRVYEQGNKAMLASGILMFLCCAGFFVVPLLRKK